MFLPARGTRVALDQVCGCILIPMHGYCCVFECSNARFGSHHHIALMEKDLTLAMEIANNSKARLPLGGQAHQLYGLLCEHG
jgi:3-hydroxyisobutyrate dehydrogenase-like beta-hydroxyacid dehydrogenase